MLKTSFLNSRKLPVITEPFDDSNSESLVETATSQREFFREQLLRYGALLLRGFKIESIAEFEQFAHIFSEKETFNYAGGVSPRIALSSGGVYTSTEYPAQFSLSLHNKLSYSDYYPRHLFSRCAVAASTGGATTLGDSPRILRRIDRKIKELSKRKKLCYTRNLQADKGSGCSWQEAFECDDEKTVEEVCLKIGADFRWKPNGGLWLSQIRPATVKHPITREEFWFNQADGFHPSNLGDAIYQTIGEDDLRLNIRFGDGSLIGVEMLAHIRSVLKSEAIPHQWQVGDVLLLDNILAAHGRMPFIGDRKILLTMT